MTLAAKFYMMKTYIFYFIYSILPFKETVQRVSNIMFITIATIYASFSLVASLLVLAAVKLSSQISRQEQLVKATIIVKESSPNVTAPYSLNE